MASDERRPNHRLRVARLQRGWTREQLAEQVAVFLAAEGGRQSAMDANHVYKLERGEITWPNASYRRALRDGRIPGAVEKGSWRWLLMRILCGGCDRFGQVDLRFGFGVVVVEVGAVR